MSISMLRPIGAWAMVALTSAAAAPSMNVSQSNSSHGGSSTEPDWVSHTVAADCLAPPDDTVQAKGKCDFPNAPKISYKWDPSCRGLGGAGCAADGLHCECRFCGAPYPACGDEGDVTDVTTSGSAPSGSTTQAPSSTTKATTSHASTAAATTTLSSTSSSPSTSSSGTDATTSTDQVVTTSAAQASNDTQVPSSSSTSAAPATTSPSTSSASASETTSLAPSTSSVAKDKKPTVSTTKQDFLDPKKNGARTSAAMLPLMHLCLPVLTALYTFAPGCSK